MLFFELLQIALGNRASLSTIPSGKEWAEIYAESERQAITGILLQGIEKLPLELRPPQALLFQWIGVGQMIEQRNRMMDLRCKELLKKLDAYGLRGAILKGQGIARLYANINLDDNVNVNDDLDVNLNLNDDLDINDNQEFENSRIKSTATDNTVNLGALRQPGDIDVYVDCGLNKALEFAKSAGQQNVDWDYKHLHLNVWDDTEVEMHYRVEVLLNLWKNRKLQKWFKEHENEIFNLNDNLNLNEGSLRLKSLENRIKNQSRIRELENNTVTNTDGTDRTDGMTTPTVEFNVFYILLHIYRHFLYEGVGFRQVIDYYFVLKQLRVESLELRDSSMLKESLAAVHKFGMERFARGLMWVMQKALGMNRDWMLWEPDQKEGEYILKQVMTGGNFGHHDKRLNHGGGKLGAVKAILTHNLHLLTHYPSDVIWAPVWIVWHKCWKLTRAKVY